MSRIDHEVRGGVPLVGRLAPAGDKSISHRALLLGAMAEGVTMAEGLAPGADVGSTASCLRALGVQIEDSGGPVTVKGARRWLRGEDLRLDAGNSGTTMRMLAGALAGREGSFILSGDRSLSGRPMDRIARPLRLMGAGITLRDDRYPPLRVEGSALEGISYDMPVASAQVKGSILLAGLRANGETTLREHAPSRDHTERILEWLGAPIRQSPGEIAISAGDLPAFRIRIPGDFSSAAFLLVAAALIPGSEIVVEQVGLNPTRTGLLHLLQRMGAEVEWQPIDADPEPYGNLLVRYSGRLHGVVVGEGDVPGAIDELPLVALAATQADGVSEVRGASELRVKESDRLAVLASGLRSLGAKVEELEDGLVLEGPVALKGGRVDPNGDHRIALTFAVAGLLASEPVVIEGWECTSISYPAFDDDLKLLAAG